MSRELLSENTTALTKKLQTRYHIGQAQVYRRQKHLNITPQKNKLEGAWLTPEQLQQLDGLHEHIQTGQPMETYQAIVNVVATTEEINQKPAVDNALVHQEQQNIAQTIAAPKIPPEIIQTEQVIGNSEAVAAIKRAAQSKAAGNLILTNLLAAEYQNHPELLDLDLAEAIASSEQVAAPKSIDPTAYAQEMLSRLRVG